MKEFANIGYGVVALSVGIAASGCADLFGAGDDQGAGRGGHGLYPDPCAPNCVAGCGSGDGCGGICECPEGTSCSGARVCVEPSSCSETCESTGWSCGTLCGESCGSCEDAQACVDGSCLTANDVSCESCTLRLVVDNVESTDHRLTQIVVSAHYAPAEGQPLPRIADLEIQVDRSVSLVSATMGEALESAGKSLFVDPITQNPWTEPSPGVFRFVALARNNTSRIAAGKLLTLAFSVNEQVGAASVRIVRKDQVFAPPEANTAIQSSAYDTPVVVH